MRRLIIGAVAALAASGAAQAASPSFEYVAKSNDAFHFVDKNSVRDSSQGFLRVWVLRYLLVPPEAVNETAYTFAQYEIDCDGERLRSLFEANYAADGAVIARYATALPWGPVLPDTVGVGITENVCGFSRTEPQSLGSIEEVAEYVAESAN